MSERLSGTFRLRAPRPSAGPGFALALIGLSALPLGCSGDYFHCVVIFAEPGVSGSVARCAVAGTAEEVCRSLELPTPTPAKPVYRAVGPYATREECEAAAPLDVLSAEPIDLGSAAADAGR